MPSPTSVGEFLDLVRKSGVLEEKRLAAHLDKLRSASQLSGEPVALATRLVVDGLLTQFQAEQFLQGRWRRFTIGKYKVLEKLGSGGMGSVYLCEHMLMRRRVAVKVLPTNKAEDPSSLERFHREARIVAALDHPNIVRAYDIDQDDKLHFLVMEHVDGSSLQEIIKRAGPLDGLRAAHYVRQAALGLQHAHEAAGIVHRDVKPGNILVDRNGIVKVLDMGLARFFHDDEDDLTKKYDENVIGTADYLAPEQALDSHGVDIRADIYSLGATFYFCLTGRTPFAEGSVAQKLIWHQTRQPRPIRTLKPDTPEGLAVVIERMMAKDPAQRYQTPQGVADALAPWTQTPIPPPPENEMPQLSPAAAPRSMVGMEGGSSRTSQAAELSPAPRKVWQVPAGGSAPRLQPGAQAGPAAVAPPTPPAPAPAPPAPAPAAAVAQPPRPQPPAAPPRPAPAPVRTAPAAPPAPVVQAPSASPPSASPPSASPPSASPPSRPAPPPPSAPAPAGLVAQEAVVTAPAAPRGTQGTTNWEDEPDSAFAEVDSSPRLPRVRRSDIRKPGRGRWLLLALLGGALLAVPAVGYAVYRVAFSDPGTGQTSGQPVVREPIRVNPAVGDKLGARLQTARPGDRFLLFSDVTESDVTIAVKDITIEPAPGRGPITWRPDPKAPPGAKLLTLQAAQNAVVKNITFDGDGKAEALLLLFGRCAGSRIENVQFRNPQKYSVLVANAEGTKEAPVELKGLRFQTGAGLAAIQFLLFDHAKKSVPVNRHLQFSDLTFEGPGIRARAPLRGIVDPTVEFPPGVELTFAP